MNVSDAYQAPNFQPSPKPKTQNKKKKRFTLVELLVAIAVIGILIGMVLPVTRRGVPEAARRTTCMNNQRQIALAMLNYESANGHFPPAYIADENGKPMHSWRVLILPFIEQNSLFERYSMDEPWNGPNNRQLEKEISAVYQCPSHNRNGNSFDTSYCVVTGPGTMFDDDQAATFDDITDGASKTIVIMEVSRTQIHWMEPRDLTMNEALSEFGKNAEASESDSSNHPGVHVVAFVDGSGRTIERTIDQAELQSMFLIADEAPSE